jgi:hypothetical protein
MTLELSVSDTPNCGVTYDQNEGKSAASFCHKVAAVFPDMVCNFYFVKNKKIGKNSTTTKAREKISTDFESLEFSNVFYVCLTKFKNKKKLLHNITHRFLLTTKLFTG